MSGSKLSRKQTSDQVSSSVQCFASQHNWEAIKNKYCVTVPKWSFSSGICTLLEYLLTCATYILTHLYFLLITLSKQVCPSSVNAFKRNNCFFYVACKYCLYLCFTTTCVEPIKSTDIRKWEIPMFLNLFFKSI